MEPVKIDWETIDSVFVIDNVFENISAPQWVDFLAPPDSSSDDASWFCRADCKHPTTHEDFLKSTPSKLLRSVSVSKLISDWTRREPMNLKRRGKVTEDNENQNPNLSTFSNTDTNTNYGSKGVNKSSAEKWDDYTEIMLEKSDEKPPKSLKATQSAKDLFGGREIFGKITEFCNELKKMAAISKAKERKDDEKDERFETSKEVDAKQVFKVLGPKEMNERAKERKPLIDFKVDDAEKSNGKGKHKRNKMRVEDAENIPVSLDLNKIKHEEKISPIRMNPPTPQGFSATRDPVKSTPSKGPKSRLMKRDVFQELQQKQNRTLREELFEKNENDSENAHLVAAKEGRSLDVFWFLKPCTLSS